MQYFFPVYLLAGSLACVLSLVLTPLVKRFALSRGIVAKPGGRNINTKPIARFGGLAVIISFWITIAVVYIFNPNYLSFVTDKILGLDRNLFGVLVGSLILLGVGIFDDIKSVKPGVKLLFHILAGLCIVGFGIKILWIHNPITGLDTSLGFLTYIIVPVWIVLMINVINWLDGADGLASGIGLIASTVLFLLSIGPGVNQPATALLALVLAGSLLGFLPYNFNPASIFLGDVGSMFIGFMLAIFAIISGGKFATAALVLGLPILDALWVILRRTLSGQAPWKADRKHLHHRFLDAGFSQRQAVLFLYAVSAIFGGIALLSSTNQKFASLIILLGLMILLGLGLVIMEIKKHEKN